MEKNHCCANCLSACSEKIFFQLKLRKIYFCCYKCKQLWQKSRDAFLKEKGL